MKALSSTLRFLFIQIQYLLTQATRLRPLKETGCLSWPFCDKIIFMFHTMQATSNRYIRPVSVRQKFVFCIGWKWEALRVWLSVTRAIRQSLVKCTLCGGVTVERRVLYLRKPRTHARIVVANECWQKIVCTSTSTGSHQDCDLLLCCCNVTR